MCIACPMQKDTIQMITANDHVIFRFMSHSTMLYNFSWVAGQQNSLSKPLQLALGFTIVPYGTHFSTTENLP